MDLWQWPRQAFRQRRWGWFVVLAVPMAVLAAIVFLIEDRIGSWANEQIDQKSPEALTVAEQYFDSVWFPVSLYSLVGVIAVVLFLVVLFRVTRPITASSNFNSTNGPSGIIQSSIGHQISPNVPRLYIGVWENQWAFGPGEGIGWFPKDDSTTRILRLHVYYHAETLTSLERIIIDVSGEEIDAINWNVIDSVQTTMDAEDCYFPIPAKIKQGKRDVLLKGFSSGQWWTSEPYSIEFPMP